MDELGRIARRYLLGELSEGEQAAFEEKYFTDSQAFEQVLQAESELVDSYARGRLSTEARERVERSYMAYPRGRERVKFAEALAFRLDQIEDTRDAAGRSAVMPVSRWQKLLAMLRGQRPLLGLATALATLLIVVGGIWFFRENERLRLELAQTEAARDAQSKRELELEQQLADERRRGAAGLAGEEARANQLAAELERLRAGERMAQTNSVPMVRRMPAFASLSLTIGGVRSAETGGPPATLRIPSGTPKVQIRLNLKEQDYASYSVALRAIAGSEIFGRQGLRPKLTAARGRQLVLTLPARQFATGDYMLTLKGVSQSGEIEDVSKSIFRVEKR